MRRPVSLCLAAACLSLLSSCTAPVAPRPSTVALPLAKRGPLDVLFVVDNSPSMLEEQERLRRTVFDDRCPIGDLQAVPPEYADPTGATFDELVELCGIAQLLAAFGSDFHLGVITSDMAVCDERLPAAQDPEGLHEPQPMRGCLQGGIITPSDNVAQRFSEAIVSVGTMGSPFERSFDALRAYLDPSSARAPGCENDLAGFLRPDARLLVIFVSDEDDCSHDAESGFPNELSDEPACSEAHYDLISPPNDPSLCHSRPDLLTPVQDTVSFLHALRAEGRTTDVFVGTIGGVTVADDGGPAPAGCVLDTEIGVTHECFESGGLSNFSALGAVCDPATTTCCTGDSTPRMVELARAVNDETFAGSICAGDYRHALLPMFVAPQGSTTTTTAQ